MKAEFDLENVLKTGQEKDIKDVIISVAQYGNEREDYEYGLELCERYYDHPNKSIRSSVRYATTLIAYNHNKIDKEIFVKVIKYTFDENNAEAEDTYSNVCGSLCSKEDRMYIRDQLQEYYEKFNLTRCDYKFIPDEIVYQGIEKVKEAENNFRFCCADMSNAFNEKLLKFDITVRNYYLDEGNDFKFCPWCGDDLGKELSNEWQDILEEEYKIDPIDYTNLTNVPDEFKTDLWWRRRYVVNGVNVARIPSKLEYPEDKLKREHPIYLIPIEDQEDKTYCCPDMKEFISPDGEYHNKIIDYKQDTGTYILKYYNDEQEESSNKSNENIEATKEIHHCPWCSLEL